MFCIVYYGIYIYIKLGFVLIYSKPKVDQGLLEVILSCTVLFSCIIRSVWFLSWERVNWKLYL